MIPVAPKTPSQRGAANRRKGIKTELDVVKWLRPNGFPYAERAVRTGYRTLDRVSADPGDITGTVGIVWSVKACAVETIHKWLRELDAMAAQVEPPPLKLLVVKKPKCADVARWPCWLDRADLVRLSVPPDASLDWPALRRGDPVRSEVGHIVPLLRWHGYGQEIAA